MDANRTLSFVKAIIRSLIISNRDGTMTVLQLASDFLANEGAPIPYARFGYQTLIAFLRSMPDVLTVYGNDCYAFVQAVTIPTIQHVQYMVQKSRRSRSSNFAQRGNRNRKLYNDEMQMRLPFNAQQTIGNWYQHESTQPMPNNSVRVQPFSKAPVNVQPQYGNHHDSTPKSQNNNAKLEPNGNKRESPPKTPCNSVQPQPCEKAPVHVEEPNRAHHDSTPKSQNTTSFYPKLEPICEEEVNVPLQPVGNQHEATPETHNNSEQLQSVCQSPVDVQKPIGNQEESTPTSHNNNAPVTVPFGNHNEGTPKTQPISKENKSPESVNPAIPTVKDVPSKKVHSGARQIQRRITCDHTNERLDAEPPCPGAMDWINMLDRPAEAMTMKHVIAEPYLTPFAIPKDVLLVRILHVVNPNRIWVRCVAHQMPFEKLQSELNAFYNKWADHTIVDTEQAYRWKMTNFQQGMYCAAFWGGCWYRGIIVGPHMGGCVKVNLVDLGVVEFIDAGHIKYLLQDFSKPNVLAIRASLAYLRPRLPIWSRADSDHLEWMLDKSEQFCASIVDYDEGHNAIDVILQGANMTNVNKTFASEVNATFVGKDQLTHADISAYGKRSRTINEKYPTFYCIEVGHFPTVSEMRRWLNRKFDLEKHYAQIPHNPEINIPQQFKMRLARVAGQMNWSSNQSKEETQG